MLIRLERDSGLPLSRQIYEGIKSLILHGELVEKERLPSSRVLSEELGVARNTVLEAYDQLLAEGYLESMHGSGTIVAAGIVPMQREKEADRKVTTARDGQERRSLRKKEVIDFRSGVPDLEAFPKKTWAKLYQRTCERLPASALRYSDPAGVWTLREAIAAYLFRIRGIRVSPDRVMITSGSTQGLFLVSRLLREYGDTALVEDPAHRGLVAVLANAGMIPQGVQVDDLGLNTALLQRLSEQERSRIAFTYVTPSHQYPLGGLLPIQRRQELVRFAQETDCAIIEDDYDSEFRYEGAPVSSLFELAPETVIYLGSFSKILAPALRLGFAIIPESMIKAWGQEKMHMDVHTDALSQYTLAEFINNGSLEKHIWKMRKLYKRKRTHLVKCFQDKFGDSVSVKGDATGLHFVACFKGIIFTDKVVDELLNRGVRVFPVEQYALSPDGTYMNELIMGYSHLSEEEMTKGVSLIKDTLIL